MLLSKTVYTDSYIQTLVAGTAMQGASEHVRSSLGFSILLKDISMCRRGESNKQPSDKKTLALPLSHVL